jgi:hypothetical protein
MRLDELVLRVPGDEIRVHFHEHLTVLCGIGLLERKALADSLTQALAGTAESTVLTYTDNTGRPVQIVSSGGSATNCFLDDGTTALPLVGTITPTEDELRALVLVQASDLGLNSTHVALQDGPELAEARATLADLTRELQAAIADRHDQDEHRQELAAIEEQLRAANDDRSRHDYAVAVADLERARAEARVLAGVAADADGDRRLLAAAPSVQELADRWAVAAAQVAERTRRATAGEPLAPALLAAASEIPDEPPAELRARLQSLLRAATAKEQLERRLRLASAEAEPSGPDVLTLAAADQDELWHAAARVEQATARLQQQQVVLDGGDRAERAEVTQRLEDSQRVVEECEAELERRWVPSIAGAAVLASVSLLASTFNMVYGAGVLAIAVIFAGVGIGLPWKALDRARAAQKLVLEEVGAPTYLAFHLRRVNAATDQDAQARTEAIASEHRHALEDWSDLAPGIDVVTARAIEGEVRVFAAGMAARGDSDVLEAERAELATSVEPACRAARHAVRIAVQPYGIDRAALDAGDVEVVERLVLRQVAIGRQARAQLALDAAKADDRQLGHALEAQLAALGFHEGTVEARAGALRWAVERATERESSRASARPMASIDDEIARLELEAARLHRPEWDADGTTPTAADAALDVDSLAHRQAELAALLRADEDVVIDLERLADRHSAMERRVATLEANGQGRSEEATTGELADVQQLLLAHLAQAAHVGPFDESMPVVLDEPFLRVTAERKWELLDMLRRLGENAQLLYLTDDPFVTAWARRRAAAGLITLLEPIDAQ